MKLALLLGLSACALPRPTRRDPAPRASDVPRVASPTPRPEISVTPPLAELGAPTGSVALSEGAFGLFRSHFRAQVDARGAVRDTAYDAAFLVSCWPADRRFVFMDRDGALYLSDGFLGALRPLGRTSPGALPPVLRGRFAALDAARIEVLGDASELVSVPLPPEASGPSGRGSAREAWFDAPRVGRAVLEDGSTWRTEDAGGRWARVPSGDRPPPSPAPPTVPLDAFQQAYLRAVLDHSPSTALHLRGLRSDEGDHAVVLFDRELRVWGPDGAPRLTVADLGAWCRLEPWGPSMAVVCDTPYEHGAGLWRLRGATLSQVSLPALRETPLLSDDGVHFAVESKVCNADTGACFQCLPLGGGALHGAALYRSAGTQISRCASDGERLVEHPALVACHGLPLLVSHPEGALAVLSDCFDASSLRAPDHLLRLTDAEPELTPLPFTPLALLVLDARHLAVGTTDGDLELSDDRGRSWSHPTSSLDAMRQPLARRCSGGACALGSAVLAVTRGDEDPDARPERPAPATDFTSWLRVRPTTCEVGAPSAPSPWGQETFGRSEVITMWLDGATLRWRSAEGTGSAPTTGFEGMMSAPGALHAFRPLRATATDLWVDTRARTLDALPTWTLFHAGAQGLRQTVAPERAYELLGAARMDSGALIHVRRLDPDLAEAVTVSAEGTVLERRRLPLRPQGEALFPGALGDRPAAVRVELTDDAVRVTAHTVDGASDRSWRAVFSREPEVPWCQRPPTVWWEQGLSGSNAVRVAGRPARTMDDHTARVGVGAAGLCLDRWTSMTAFDAPPGDGRLLLSVRCGPDGWIARGTSALRHQLFTYPVRCGMNESPGRADEAR